MAKLLKRIQLKTFIFAGFILLHVFLMNINAAEWGDSYRILRASEYVRRWTYPVDEKRPPLFSVVLAARPHMDQVEWGRVVMFVFSLASFLLFEQLTRLYVKEEKFRNFALLLFAFNPVLFYWSLRIYADVPFMFFVLLSFYLYKRWENSISFAKLFLIGIVAGLGVLTRFEGYLLGGSIGLALLLRKDFRVGIKNALFYSVGLVLSAVPYWIQKNPFVSSYFEEPGTRVYDLKMLAIYFLSLLFIFGFTSAFYFIFKNVKGVVEWGRQNKPMAIFLIVELLLILSWPAAVPRLFVPTVPILIIVLVQSISRFFESGEKRRLTPLLYLTTFLAVYAVGQYFFKLQFLIVLKWVFISTVILQFISIYFIYTKKFTLFAATVVLSVLVWSISTVWLHKDNFIAIKTASLYAANNLKGVVGYNDVSSVSDWYLNERNPGGDVKGEFYSYDKKGDLEHDKLLLRNFDYLILTNEHNTDMTLDFSNRPYLYVLQDYRFNVGGKVFFAKVIRVNQE